MTLLINKIKNKVFQKTRRITPILFMHIPKCGGTSLYKALAKCIYSSFPDGHIDPIATRDWIRNIYQIQEPEVSAELQITRHALVQKAISDSKNFIAGHFTLNKFILDSIPPEYLRVTMLRNPEERFFSHFKYWILTRDLASSPKDLNLLWNEYINSNRAVFQANLFGIYLGEGFYQSINETNVNQALINLTSFDVVGDLSDINEFQSMIYKKTGKSPVIQNQNTSKDRIPSLEIKDAFDEIQETNKDTIKSMCKWDITIFNRWFEQVKK